MISSLEPGGVFLDLYWIPLDFSGPIPEHWWRVLEEEERERAMRFHFSSDRNRWVASRALLRGLLGKYLDLPPERISFESDPEGKPRLSTFSQRSDPLFFNISHSGDRMLAGLSSIPEIGVDAELVRPIDAFLDIAHRFFARSEFEHLQSVSPEDRLLHFYRIWTRKEAFLKATGEGLTRNLSSFEVSLERDANSLLRIDNRSGPVPGWHLGEPLLEPSYVSAYCVAGVPGQVRSRIISHSERESLLLSEPHEFFPASAFPGCG